MHKANELQSYTSSLFSGWNHFLSTFLSLCTASSAFCSFAAVVVFHLLCFSVLPKLVMSSVHRNKEHFGHADKRICSAPLCRLPSSCDLTSRRAAGPTECSTLCLVASTQPHTLLKTSNKQNFILLNMRTVFGDVPP